MIDKIIERIKTGSIKRVIPKGFIARMEKPYIVVAIDGQELRVWAHFKNDQHAFLEDYCRAELSELLNGYQFTTFNGNTARIQPATGEVQGYSRIVLNEDNTISKERRWIIPGRLH